MATITVQPEYGYVVLTAVSTCFLGLWHGIRVGQFRRSAGLGYPCPYADSAQMSAANPDIKRNMYLFNCAQRAHGNFLENQASAIFAMLVAGLKYPLATTALGLGWVVFRIAYAVGYTSKDKENGKGRLIGLPWALFQLGLFGLAGWTGYSMAF